MKISLLFLFIFASFGWSWNLYPSYPRYLKRHSKYVKNFFFKAKTNDKIVALTFDDGPNYHTRRLMKVLKKYQTPATFFLIGKNLSKKYDNLFKEALFDVGMHSFYHSHFNRISQKRVDKDFKKAIRVFKKHGLSTNLFRPPFGTVDKKVSNAIKKFGLNAIMWSNDTNDWSKKKSYSKVIKNLSAGDIILMHDHSTSPKNLEKLIKSIKKRGFKIVPLRELIKNSTLYPQL